MIFSEEQKIDGQAPARLFLELWRIVGAWSPAFRGLARIPDQDFFKRLVTILRENCGTTATKLIRSLLSESPSTNEERSKYLLAMEAIDDLYYEIHPRAVKPPSGTLLKEKPPNWLNVQSDFRRRHGHFSEDEKSRVIPRGPLQRGCRAEYASYGDSLADRFAALSVVPNTLYEAEREIKVIQQVIGVSGAEGVVPGAERGSESVLFMPIAENPGDLLLAANPRTSGLFMSCTFSPSINPAQRLLDILEAAGPTDIGIAPELVMDEICADQVAHSIVSSKFPPRLLLAGSGLSEKKENGQSWNEARILNKSGKELWRQRKIWPAGITKARAIEYGLPDPGDSLILEDTAAGNLIWVMDIDALGRCIVLICQDLESAPLSDDLIRHYQPDWVFSPVLDRGVVVGRWAHQRAFSLSSRSQARFIISGSTSLASPGSLNVDCGLAIGPKEPRDEKDKTRVYQNVRADKGTTSKFTIIKWRSGVWEETSVNP